MTFGYISGNFQSLRTTPSGRESTSRSPPWLNRNVVCNGPLAGTSPVPLAKTNRYPFGGIATAGKVHLSGTSTSSLKCQPSKLTGCASSLYNSIQSDGCPDWSSGREASVETTSTSCSRTRGSITGQTNIVS